MPPFPYYAIFKRAAALTLELPWLWFFGSLVSFLVLPGIAKAAMIWAGNKLAEPELGRRVPKSSPPEINHRTAFAAGRKFAGRIIGLQLLVVGSFLLLLGVFALPVWYLWAQAAAFRAIILGVLGVLMLGPMGVALEYMHFYGPVFIVLYRSNVVQALSLSFALLKQKFVESIILAAFLVGLLVIFIFLLMFSIILLALPLVALWLLTFYWGYAGAATVLKVGAIFIGSIYALVALAAFTVFENLVWVLAVREMVRTPKVSEEEEKELAVEPAEPVV